VHSAQSKLTVRYLGIIFTRPVLAALVCSSFCFKHAQKITNKDLVIIVLLRGQTLCLQNNYVGVLCDVSEALSMPMVGVRIQSVLTAVQI
jgi:hypothetical protein